MTRAEKRHLKTIATAERPPCDLCRAQTWPDWGRCLSCGHYFCQKCSGEHRCGVDFKSHEQREEEERKRRESMPEPNIAGALEALMATFKRGPVLTPEQVREHTLKTRIFPRLRKAGFHVRFHRELTGDWGEPRQFKAFEICRNLLCRTGAVVALVGVRGCGKTTVAAQLALARAWEDEQSWQEKAAGLRPETTCRATPYYKLTDLLHRFKALYADFGTVDPERLAEGLVHLCTSSDLMVIDEVHECDELKTRGRLLTDIIDRRYAAKNGTLLICNLKAEEFERDVDASVLSRIHEHGKILECTWGSWREK